MRDIVVGLQQMRKRALGQLRQVGLLRQSAAHTPDGVLDTSFLPERMGIAEESLDAEGVKLVMAGELRPVVKIDCLPSLTRESTQDLGHGADGGAGRLNWGPEGDEEAGVAVVQGQGGLPVGAEQD